ncbi:hypothetical protein PRUPE_2G058700 [Prunus persica]|uniref:Uncharacterized protein n=1 Tax=Prunus persica TaxID=3760 RepID=M5XN31_PRUPE|nr:hypothetical protein PRUPE_2G058700 [Prunus persica]
MGNCISNNSNNEFPLNNITNELESLMTVPTHSQVLHYSNEQPAIVGCQAFSSNRHFQHHKQQNRPLSSLFKASYNFRSKPPSLSSILSQTRAQKLGCFEQWLFVVFSDQFRPPQLRFSRDKKLRSRALEMELIVEPRHPGPGRPVGGTSRRSS